MSLKTLVSQLMTPDPYLTHTQLLTLIRIFAPNMNDRGVCDGTTKMWIQAVLTDNEEEGTFYARSAHLPFHFARLNNKIKKLKKEIDILFKRQIHSPHPFNADELNKIEIRSFSENVAAHQHLAYTGISEDVLIQNDPIVYSLTRSKKLEEKGFHIYTIQIGSLAPTQEDLIGYLKDIVALASKQSQNKIVFALHTTLHTIGLYFDQSRQFWILFDVNLEKPNWAIELKNESLSELVTIIFDCLFSINDNHTVFALNYYTTHFDFDFIKALQDITFSRLKPSTFSRLNSENYNLLLLSVICNQSEVVQYLINQGDDINFIHTSGFTALLYALNFKRPHIAKMLIEKSANIHYISPDKWSPLRLAFCRKNTEIAKILIEKGAQCKNSASLLIHMPMTVEEEILFARKVVDLIIEFKKRKKEAIPSILTALIKENNNHLQLGTSNLIMLTSYALTQVFSQELKEIQKKLAFKILSKIALRDRLRRRIYEEQDHRLFDRPKAIIISTIVTEEIKTPEPVVPELSTTTGFSLD